MCASDIRRLRAVLIASMAAGLATMALAAQELQFSDRHRPRMALVLPGGGARRFAHVGVLRVLRERQVPIDLVIGTSMMPRPTKPGVRDGSVLVECALRFG